MPLDRQTRPTFMAGASHVIHSEDPQVRLLILVREPPRIELDK